MKRAILPAVWLLASALLPAQSITPVQPEALKHWRDARFGMFIHWGPVSLTGKEIGWSRGAGTPVEEYDQLYQRFNPTAFNADDWVSTAKAAGMKYIVLTTKHHDGFCLWDSKITDYDITATPFKRDVVRELSAACKKGGIPLRLLLHLRLAPPGFPPHQPRRENRPQNLRPRPLHRVPQGPDPRTPLLRPALHDLV